MQLNGQNELLSIKREKFRIEIRNQKLKEEFSKKRKHFNLQQQKNEMLHKVNQELTIYINKAELFEEDFYKIKMLLQVFLKALEDDENLDNQLTENLVNNLKFFMMISTKDDDFLELSMALIQCLIFCLNKEDFQKYEIFESQDLLHYFERNINPNHQDMLPQILTSLTNLLWHKQIYLDFVTANNYALIDKLIKIDIFRQYSECVLGLINQVFNNILKIDLQEFYVFKEYVYDSYFDDNLGIKRLVLQIIQEVPLKLDDGIDAHFSNEFIQSKVFKKIYDDALRQKQDYLSKQVVATYFGLSSEYNDIEIPYYENVVGQKFQQTEVSCHYKVSLYWSISNKIIQPQFLKALLESQILQTIFDQYQYESQNENLELTFIIQNLCQQGNQEQISKLFKMNLIIICENLFNIPHQQIQENIIKSLLLILKKLTIITDQNNELIIPFNEVKNKIESTSLVEKISHSNCLPELIQEFDVFF